MLDQLCKGLKTLGVLDQIRSNASLYEKLFIGNTVITAEELLKQFDFENPEDPNNTHLTRFVEQSSSDTMQSILIFTTGARFIPRKKITVSFENRNDFFSSICSMKLYCPIFRKYEDFKNAFSVMILGRSFTSV